jgi:CelD/BcsL family acetyltransferase involved in cellulose biosynthesis
MSGAAELVPAARTRARRTAVPAAGVIAPAEAAAIREAWARLAANAAEDNVFFHPDFALPAIGCFGHDRVRLAAIARGDGLLAAAPFVESRLGHIAPAVRLWSHDYGPNGAPLLEAANPYEAARALLAAIAPAPSGRAVIVPDLPLEGPAAAALARAARATRRSTSVLARRTRAAIVRDEAGAGDAKRGLSHHRRHEYARLLRRLGETGTVEIDTASEPEAVAAQLEEFLALEAAGWKGQGGTALASTAERAAFARTAVAAGAGGAARIHSLRVDRRVIAALVTLVGGATACTWKIAYDEAFARFSPGAQVLLAAIRDLAAHPSIAVIDSCAGPNHALADPLFADRMAMGTLVISPVGEGALYRAGLAAAKVEAAAKDQARRIRDRLA